jgi:hypothetical protein
VGTFQRICRICSIKKFKKKFDFFVSVLFVKSSIEKMF